MTELFCKLYENVAVENKKWWPNFGTFEVVVGAILTQNTKWQKVELALQNLRRENLISAEKIAEISQEGLALLIKPSGFYNTKAKRLKALCEAIVRDFTDFENFALAVDREWLISQKGVGAESCDSILCYACARPEMVIDSYTLRILGALGYEFESYDEAKDFMSGLDFAKIYALTNLNDENEVYALYHGLCVEFCKAHLKGKNFDDFAMKIFAELN